MQTKPFRIGTRGSPLALAQAHEARNRLMAAHRLPREMFEVVVLTTCGDRITDRALSELGGKGLITKELESNVLIGNLDFAVHSAKDMPTILPEGLHLSAYLPREDVRDAFKYVQDIKERALNSFSTGRRHRREAVPHNESVRPALVP